MQRQLLAAFTLLVSAPIGFSQAVAHAQPLQTPIAASTSTAGPKIASPAVAANYGKLPLSFEMNRGQSDSRVKFISRGAGYSLFLTGSAAVLNLSKPGLRQPDVSTQAVGDNTPLALAKGRQQVPMKTGVVRMELAGAARNSRVAGADELPGKANYFIGKDSTKWHTNIPTYAKVKYSGVYPGVDLVYYGNQRQLEYDFIVAPGASAKPVKLHFAGASQLKLDPDGDLTVVAKNGEIAFRKPIVYQEKNGQRELVEGRFSLRAKNTVEFKLGDYDRSRQLVIDPVLGFSTFLSANSTDSVNLTALGVDSAGYSYLINWGWESGCQTGNPFAPTIGAFHTADGCMAIIKLNPAGTAVNYISLFGSDSTSGNSIAFDGSGNAYITGMVDGDFPITPGAFQPTYPVNASPAFVTKLSPNGNLLYSTFLGGSDVNEGNSIAVSSSGEAYVAGTTTSPDFPVTSGALQTTNTQGSILGFVSELNAAGSALVYSTFLGGSASTHAQQIALDKSGNVYVGGYAGPGFPTTKGAYQTAYPDYVQNCCDTGFVAKLNPTLSGLVFATYMPSGSFAFDSSGNAYVAGQGSNPPATPGAFQTNGTQLDGTAPVVAKLNSSGTALVYCTYLGGSTGDGILGVTADAAGDAYVTGSTADDDFPITSDAYQKVNKAYGHGADAFLTELNPSGSALVYSTYLGGVSAGNTLDSGVVVVLDSLGNAYVAGNAETHNFPATPGAYITTNATTSSNGFLAEFVFNGETSTAVTSDANPQVAGTSVSFTAYVASTANADIPGGKVRFFIDNAFAGDVTLDDTGHAVYSTATLTPGPHTVNASYFGDVKDAASVGLLTETITGQTAAPNFLPVPGTYRTTATVTIADATSGAIIHYTTDGSAPGLGSPVYSAPIALTATTTLKAIAVAAGQSQSATASGTYTFVPGAHATSVSLASSLVQATYGEPLTLTATVKTTDRTTATGTVTFLHGDEVIGAASLINGVATLTTTTLSDGSHGITAEYSGSATEAVSGSPTVVVVVNP
jgi:hypothetical protein